MSVDIDPMGQDVLGGVPQEQKLAQKGVTDEVVASAPVVDEVVQVPVVRPPLDEVVVDDLAPVKEVPLQDAKLFSVSGDVLKLESGGQISGSFAGAQIVEGFVDIKDADGVLIGSGVTTVVGGFLHVEGHIDYASPLRLDIQNGQKVFFHFWGGYEMADVTPGKAPRLQHLHVKEVALSNRWSLDGRVQPVLGK